MKTRTILLLLFVCVNKLLFAQQPSSTFPATDLLPSVKLPPDIDRVLRDYEREWGAGNTEKLAALFTPDGFVLQPRRPAIQGQEKLKKAYQNQGGAPLFLRALSFAQDGTVGYIIGAYRSAANTPDIGKFILALRKGKDGRWLIAADMDNSAK
ncbi:YybH family protein [Spirosoma aerolatum]|uniref:YybH family protein n=1 Tax=Spirosoma aerolatum TaxID=1211326 RepID=UPI0009AE0274|nr:nuclear transport factor 2 family protein [Spirosoma aerolatum]